MKYLKKFENMNDNESIEIKVGDEVEIQYPDRIDKGVVIEELESGDFKVRDTEGHVFPVDKDRLSLSN